MTPVPADAATSRDDLGMQLGFAFAAFVERLDAAMARAGFEIVTSSFGYVIRSLAPGPKTLTELAAGLQMTTQGAAKIVDEMERAGYLQRVPHPTDGRAKQIELSPRGRAAFKAARRIHRRIEDELVAEIGVRKVAALRSGLAALIELSDVDPADRVLRPL